MEAPQVAENVSPQVVMVTGKPVCAQASAYDPGGFPRCPRHAKREYAYSQDELRTRPEDESVPPNSELRWKSTLGRRV